MGHFGFWVLLVVAGSLACFGISSVQDSAIADCENANIMQQGGLKLVLTNRKLKEGNYGVTPAMNKRDLGGINLEDYPPFDPTPSSVAAVTAGPIEHGTPVMPYIPRPAPPGQSMHGSP